MGNHMDGMATPTEGMPTPEGRIYVHLERQDFGMFSPPWRMPSGERCVMESSRRLLLDEYNEIQALVNRHMEEYNKVVFRVDVLFFVLGILDMLVACGLSVGMMLVLPLPDIIVRSVLSIVVAFLLFAGIFGLLYAYYRKLRIALSEAHFQPLINSLTSRNIEWQSKGRGLFVRFEECFPRKDGPDVPTIVIELYPPDSLASVQFTKPSASETDALV
eukprot:TRINITY_DN7056_c0_g1_i1.p1 TRINITY_DN7056_c0_g1~~TRINITY_DN7056_c0_g1_i1.p1  ORF type:complete len:217 (+),score=23.23 TRINITY_DN7056_c0_g1_i1:151-801(+)